MKIEAYILLFALLLAGCSTVDTECREDVSVDINIALKGDSLRLNSDSTAYEHVQYTTMSQATVVGVGRDSIVYDRQNLSKMVLKLRQDTTITAYAICYKDQWDTIWIEHQNDQTFYSLACGCIVYHTLDGGRHSGHFIDSVTVNNTQVTTKDDTHMTIWFRD